MRDRLAEKLLAEVMEWETEDVARERPILQSMAKFKYDDYQKFMPGMRFIESLALWLGQFPTLEKRRIAYSFVRERLIFISNAEMNHFVEMSYPDFIVPILARKVAEESGIERWHVGKAKSSNQFQIARRKSLFLGLSDGSRIDLFRRSNPELNHEQIYLTYEVADDRADKLLEKLQSDLGKLPGFLPDRDGSRFETVVLLDDFSGSGISYIRKDKDGGLDGKVAKFLRNVFDSEMNISRLIHPDRTKFILVLYIATEQARNHFERMLRLMISNGGNRFSVEVVNPLSDSIRLSGDVECDFNSLINDHYDSALETEHTDLGGDGVRYGFGKCGLPLILPHNTPNNSLALLWGATEKLRALFPRVSRHK